MHNPGLIQAKLNKKALLEALFLFYKLWIFLPFVKKANLPASARSAATERSAAEATKSATTAAAEATPKRATT